VDGLKENQKHFHGLAKQFVTTCNVTRS